MRRVRVLGKLGLIGAGVLISADLIWQASPIAQAQSGKLVVIVMENETYSNIVHNSQAPYLNQLIADGKLFTNYTAVASGSTPDYLAMTTGLTSALAAVAQYLPVHRRLGTHCSGGR